MEIDGWSHDGTEAYDTSREAFLISLGYRVVRLTNAEVLEDAQARAHAIMDLAPPGRGLG